MSDYIPPELIPNILARLLIKDVLRCTAVCKSWYYLITSSSFTSLHLKLSTPSQKPPLLVQYRLCNTRIQKPTLLVQNHTLEEISLPDTLPNLERFDVVGSFNGLFLLHMELKDGALLWNPSLRKSVVLPNPRDLPECYWHKLGFCFLPATSDYKIVWFSYPLFPQDKVKGQIYELSTGSWRSIVDADNIPYVICVNSTQTVLKDVIHWPANGRDNLDQKLIGSFNMKTESFGTLMLPNLLHGSSFLKFICLSTFEESICLSYTQDWCCVIWVMKEYGVADSWAKRFRIDIGCRVRSLVYFRENGEILLDTFRDGTGKDLVLCDALTSKLIKKIKPVHPSVYCFMANSYMESLVLIKGLTNNEEEVNTGCKKARLG